MTKKDYELIAEALAMVRPAFDQTERRIAWNDCVRQITRNLAATNSRFNADRFVGACGMGFRAPGQYATQVDINA